MRKAVNFLAAFFVYLRFFCYICIMKKFLLILTVACALLSSCGQGTATGKYLHEDDVAIAIDETFRAIMEEELSAFAASHVEATMLPVYCSEDSAIRLLMADSVKSCIATRDFTPEEKAWLKKHKRSVRSSLIAADAIALIINKQNTDSVISVEEIRDILSGKITKWNQLSYGKREGDVKLLFDDSGSSTVRFMRDSINNGQDFAGNVYAQGSNEAVIEKVLADPNAIGVVSTDFLRSTEGKALTSWKDLKFRVMHVSRKRADSYASYWPFQYYIATGDYPLVRKVYVLNTDGRTRSQVLNLYFFLKDEHGQLIILNNSQLLPRSRVQFRAVNVRE